MKALLKEKTGKPVGIIRQMDGLGRLVIPMEYRKKLNINALDDCEMILFDDNTILIQKCEVNK